MAINKIVKQGVESRAVLLYEKYKSYDKVAKGLSEVLGEPITKSTVQRYFATRDQEKQRAVEKSDQLKAKIAEAEINTVQGCLKCIEDLQDICKDAKEAGDLKTAILAIDSIYKGLDMLNKVLGKYQTLQQNQFNFMEVNLDGARERIISRIAGIASRAGQIEDPEYTES